MIFGEGLLGLLMFGLWIFCIIDVITTDEAHVRNLPKVVWLLLVILMLDLGAIAWLIAGRRWGGAHAAVTQGSGVGDRPQRRGPTNPDDDEEFLRGLRARADEQRRSYQDKHETDNQGDDGPRPDPSGEDG